MAVIMVIIYSFVAGIIALVVGVVMGNMVPQNATEKWIKYAQVSIGIIKFGQTLLMISIGSLVLGFVGILPLFG
jgi:hypothetical protein